MIDKIIRELKANKFEYWGCMNDGDKPDLLVPLDRAIEIVKKYDNDGWIDVNNALPEVESTQFNKVQYLCAMDSETYQTLSYCEGWNCFRNYNGEVEKESEIDSVLAWKEVETYKRKVDN